MHFNPDIKHILTAHIIYIPEIKYFIRTTDTMPIFQFKPHCKLNWALKCYILLFWVVWGLFDI